jgi:hypothetical protein
VGDQWSQVTPATDRAIRLVIRYTAEGKSSALVVLGAA